MAKLVCSKSGHEYPEMPPLSHCPKDGSQLRYEYDLKKASRVNLRGPLGVWRYRYLLPSMGLDKRVSLAEGGTPLVKATKLGKHIGVSHLVLKNETRSHTNSFRDRAASVMASNALSLGYKHVICASNGNMGASIAAYCAKANLECLVLVPNRVDLGKMAQMYAYRASVLPVGETVDETIAEAQRRVEVETDSHWYQATPEYNPLSFEAQKTIAFELSEQSSDIDVILIPMGGGGTIFSIWKGYSELLKMKKVQKIPRLIGVQSSNCNPIALKFHGKKSSEKVEIMDARALAILVPNPLDIELALEAIKQSGGTAISVTNQEISKAEQQLAQMEAVFAEPASAATVAGVEQALEAGLIEQKEQVVCLITGSGLKTPYVLEALAEKRKKVGFEPSLSVKLKILRILEVGSSYGYAIWNQLGRKPAIQAVYQHLGELENKGLVSARMEEKRKVYTLTDRGRRALKAWEELAWLF